MQRRYRAFDFALRGGDHQRVKVTEIYVDPIGKPRMTQRDRWKKRPCVMRYFAAKDIVKSHRIEVDWNNTFELTFYIPMPKSWSKKRRKEMLGKPHQQKPDIDNLQKFLFDSLLEDDSIIWSLKVEKYWAEKGKIVIKQE